jgi:hypothetical protein
MQTSLFHAFQGQQEGRDTVRGDWGIAHRIRKGTHRIERKRTNHCLNLACYLILIAIQYVFQRTFSKTKQSKISIYNTITAKMPLRKNALKKEI